MSRCELSSHLLNDGGISGRDGGRVVHLGNTTITHVDHRGDHAVAEVIVLEGSDEGVAFLAGIVEAGVGEAGGEVLVPAGELQDLPDLSRVSLLADLDGPAAGLIELEPFAGHHEHTVADSAGHGVGPRDLLFASHLRDAISRGLHPLRIHDGDVERIVRKL